MHRPLNHSHTALTMSDTPAARHALSRATSRSRSARACGRSCPLARERLGIPEESLEPYGRYKAKVSLDYVAQLADRPDGKLILVTAISPTPAGEGKTTTTVGLGRCAQPARQARHACACASRRSGRCSA